MIVSLIFDMQERVAVMIRYWQRSRRTASYNAFFPGTDTGNVDCPVCMQYGFRTCNVMYLVDRKHDTPSWNRKRGSTW